MQEPAGKQGSSGRHEEALARLEDALPTEEFVVPVRRDVTPDSPTAPLPAPASGPASDVATASFAEALPLPASGLDATRPFPATLAVPGQELTKTPAAPSPAASAAPETTTPFVPTLPLPGQGAPPQEGAQFGPYRVGARLALGPAGSVHWAEGPRGPCRLELRRAGGAEDRRAFLLAARLCTTLDHPHLLRVLDLGADPQPWLATEPLDATSLRGLLASGSLEAERAGRFAKQIASALRYAHARRVVHGDLRPDDLLLVGDAVKLSGLARLTAIAADGERLAHPGGPGLGPAPYTAPELFEGQPPSPASDIYALGAILSEALLGYPPFVGSPSDVKRAALEQWPTLPDPTDPREHALLQVAWRCLAKKAHQRYPSAAALESALGAALARGEEAARKTPAEPPSAGAWLVPGLLLAAVLVTLGVLAGVLLAG